MQLKRNKEMEFETLKKNYKKQFIIGTLAICVIGGALTFNLTRAKYRVDGSIDLAKGTVNYKSYDFKIMAMYQSEDGTNYTEITNRMPSSGYIINESKSYCTTDNKNKDSTAKIYTENGKHIFESLKKTDKCYIYFDKVKITDSTSLIANSKINIGSPDFNTTAETDEGIYAVSDGMYGGTSYYWRGAATTNYLKFAGFCWRIVRINGDKSIRLIYDGETCHANGTQTSESIAVAKTAYNTSANQSNYVGWTYSGTSQRTLSGTASNAKTQLESWYSNNITGTNASKVAQGKYCNDRDSQSDNMWTINGTSFHYSTYNRIMINKQPTLSCPSGDIYTINVGLITADEVMYAGGNGNNITNISYYLYNYNSYWTMSPSGMISGNIAAIFIVTVLGNLSGPRVDDTSESLRPVINLKSDVTFSGGDGTLNNPYVVE